MSEEMKPSFQNRLRAHWAGLKTKIGSISFTQPFSKAQLAQLQNFDFAAAANRLSRTFQQQSANFYGGVITLVLCTYFLADLTALLVGKYIPEPPPVRAIRPSVGTARRNKVMDDYNIIFVRNLVNSQGLIPGDDSPAGDGKDLGGPPVRTSLPFNLVGTVILEDENRSVGTIEDKSASQVYPVRVLDEIPGKAKILKVEPRKVIFINTTSGRREFVDLPDDLQVSNPRLTLSSSSASRGAPAAPGIEKLSPNQFNISRTEVDKAISDLNNILTQARAVPNMENGQPSGYKLFQIVPGSIYDKLGLQNGDVIAGLNGAPVNDPGKAFEMINELKTTSHLELQIKRDGRTSTFTYDIH